jgi:2-polyprenyl-3-methyl-5-hydroxy-6-metoxy-1,4-benzoquinol methylase
MEGQSASADRRADATQVCFVENMAHALNLLSKHHLIRTGPHDHADWNYRGLLGWVEKQRYQMLLELIGTSHFHRALEVGYGSGVFFPELARHADELAGVDVHDKARNVATVLAARGMSVQLEQAPAEALPFADQTFDAVFAVSALEFVSDMDHTASELSRVLSPEGSLFVVTPGKSAIVDFGLWALTGKSAKTDFADRRERVLPALARLFRVERRVQFPAIPMGLRLYTGLRLAHR